MCYKVLGKIMITILLIKDLTEDINNKELTRGRNRNAKSKTFG